MRIEQLASRDTVALLAKRLRHVPRGKYDAGTVPTHTDVSLLSYDERPKEVRCVPGNAAQVVERGAGCG